MGDRRVTELGRSAATKGSELGRTAATKGGELGRTAASKGADVGRAARARGAEIGRNMKQLDIPWVRCGFGRTLRELLLSYGLGPMIDWYCKTRVYGREHFRDTDPPVILVANHSSHLDTPTILRALPRKWRQRTAVAAAADYFYKQRALAHFVALMFNTVPIARGGGSGDGAMDHVDRLIDQRWNLVMFPEGTRSRDGRIHKLKSGAATIAERHDIAIVPIFLKGTYTAMPPGQNWPKRIRGRFLSHRHQVEVHFGEPIRAREGESPVEAMARVRAFLAAEAGEPVPAEPREPSLTAA